jgi:hypothetical protein
VSKNDARGLADPTGQWTNRIDGIFSLGRTGVKTMLNIHLLYGPRRRYQQRRPSPGVAAVVRWQSRFNVMCCPHHDTPSDNHL